MADATDVARGLQLVVDGWAYGGWKSVDVSLGMEHCSGQFDVSVSERWPGFTSGWKIAGGSSCIVKLLDEVVITGYVDAVTVDITPTSAGAQIGGRDKTGDLVDCSAINAPGQWRGLKIEQIAAEIAKPFGIAVRADVDTGKALPSFSLQAGETAFDAIERAARIRALLVTTDGLGNLVLTRAGTKTIATAIVEGKNLKTGNARYDTRDRYSRYILKGQTSALAWSTGSGDSAQPGTSASQVKAEATDPGVTRYRPLLVTSSDPDVAATLQQRAQWEANVRAARSVIVDVVVPDWSHADGLWAVNQLVHVQSESMRVDDLMLIKAVRFTVDQSGGAVTALTLTKKDAYTVLPMKDTQGSAPLAFVEPKGTTK